MKKWRTKKLDNLPRVHWKFSISPVHKNEDYRKEGLNNWTFSRPFQWYKMVLLKKFLLGNRQWNELFSNIHRQLIVKLLSNKMLALNILCSLGKKTLLGILKILIFSSDCHLAYLCPCAYERLPRPKAAGQWATYWCAYTLRLLPVEPQALFQNK